MEKTNTEYINQIAYDIYNLMRRKAMAGKAELPEYS